MGYRTPTMKNGIIDLPTAHEQWGVLIKGCRPSNDISISIYLDQFHSYEPRKGATIDSTPNDLRGLQSAIFTSNKDEAPSEKAKTRALLRAYRSWTLGSKQGLRFLKTEPRSLTTIQW